MTDKAVKREFSFTDREAGIVARCELGVGDLPRRLSLMLGATAAATVALRAARKMPLPSFALLGCYAAAVTAWVVFLVYLDRRLKLTAADVASRTLGLYWSGEGMELYDLRGTAAVPGGVLPGGDGGTGRPGVPDLLSHGKGLRPAAAAVRFRTAGAGRAGAGETREKVLDVKNAPAGAER